MIAPGNSEDAASPFRTAQMDLWVRGTTRAAPLARDKVEALSASRTRLAAVSYTGPAAPPERTVPAADPAARFIPAIPPVGEALESKTPLPGRYPRIEVPYADCVDRRVAKQLSRHQERLKLHRPESYGKNLLDLTDLR
jgi:hypothetical protein